MAEKLPGFSASLIRLMPITRSRQTLFSAPIFNHKHPASFPRGATLLLERSKSGTFDSFVRPAAGSKLVVIMHALRDLSSQLKEGTMGGKQEKTALDIRSFFL